MDKQYDFIFAGGGLAALSLAFQLARSPLRDRSMLIVDRDAKDRNDRTWCFWTKEPTPFEAIVHRSWRQFRLAGGGQEQVVPLADYRYQMIRGLDLYQFVRQELAALPNVTFLRGVVERIEDGPQGASVMVDGQAYQGRWVFDSRFRFPPSGASDEHALRMQQRFKGWEVETIEDAFDPRTPTFMDFRTPQDGQMRFFYVLPLSTRRALVECVSVGCVSVECVSMDVLDYDRALKGYLSDVLGVKSYRVVRHEGGASPLTDQPFRRRAGASIMNIGVLGGMIKPSTGYAFLRIQEDSRAIVASLLKTGQPFGVPASSPYYRLCDAVMLQIMSQRGDWLGSILARLFRNNPVDRVFRFLDEVSTPAQNVRLMASLPILLFVRAGLAVILRGWRGRQSPEQVSVPWPTTPGLAASARYHDA